MQHEPFTLHKSKPAYILLSVKMTMILRRVSKMNMMNVQFTCRRSMNMNVQIISKETIKPSSPTPDRLRTYKLSEIDQIVSHTYIPLAFFYSHNNKRSDNLKKSLSETLTRYYPFAGQLRDSLSIDCNDHGVDYIEAIVSTDMSKVIEKPDLDFLQQLFPRNPQVNYNQLSNEGVLAVQVNHFSCGKIAVCVSIWHGIADGAAAAHFMKNWAAIARGATTINNIDSLVVDLTSTFRPKNFQGFSMDNFSNIDPSSNFITKRLLFDGLKIKALTHKLGSESGLVRVSPGAVVSTLIWSASIAIAQQKQRKIKTHTALNTVNLRKRMNPRLQEQCIGNVFHTTKAQIPEEKNIAESYNVLLREMVKSTRMVENEYVRKIHEDVGYINYSNDLAEALRDSSYICFTNACRFPFYEVDFGWGKPVQCCIALYSPHVVILMDSNDGEGIEASVTMPMEDIEKLEQNPGILAYTSIDPNV